MSDINLTIQNTPPPNLTISTGLGEQGPQGPQGPAGQNAPVNVVSIGTVATSSPGSAAAATMTGTAPNQTLNLTIPRGDVGATGATGATGPAGPTNSLAIGSVTTSNPGENAVATITGTAPSQTLNLTLPRGATGPQGATGPANSLSIGTVSTGAEGSSASAAITGTAPNQTLSLTIPRGNTGATGSSGPQGPQGATGPTGPANSLSIGTVTTGAAGSSAAAAITGTAPSQTLSLTIPTGATGPQGPATEAAPVGSIIYFPASTAPSGWLICNGQAVSRATYADLFATIGTTFGAGNGSTTFNVPELRGEFIRGWDNGRGIDSGRTLGSAQSEAVGPHSHSIPLTTISGRNTSSGGGEVIAYAGATLNTGNGSGTETRPRNVAMLPCIKALQTAAISATGQDVNSLAAAKLDLSGGTITGDLSVTGSFSAPNTFGFKNRIINGAFAIDQRNNGAAQNIGANSFGYTLDRWYITTAGGALTSQRIGSQGAYSWRVTGGTGNTSSVLVQRIESTNIGDLAGKTVTISFTASSSTLTSIGVTAQTPTAVDNYASSNSAVAVGTASLTSTPTRFSYTFTMPASATNGVQVYFSTGAFTSGTLTISNVQLEAGSAATAFDVRPYGTELALCQRYLQKSYSQNIAIGSAISPAGSGGGLNGILTGIGSSSGGLYLPIPLAVVMRAQPTIVIYDGAGNPAKVSYYTSTWFNNGSCVVCTVFDSRFTTFPTQTATWWGFDYSASAEL